MPAARPNRVLDLTSRTAAVCFGLMLVVIAASAWLRLLPPRIECPSWPGCRVVAPMADAARPAALNRAPAESAVRITHRVAATVVLLGALAMAAAAFRASGGMFRTPALGLAFLVLALSAIGVATPGTRSAWVPLANLLGGLACAACAWSIVRRTARPPPQDAVPGAAAVALLWLLQAALGGASGLGLSLVPGQAHAVLGLAVAAAAAAVATRAWRAGRRAEALALAAVAVLQTAAGALAGQQGAAALPVWLHNTGAAPGLALLVGLAGQAGRPHRPVLP